MLLHGYMGSHLSWRHHIEPLAARHRVLALDWFTILEHTNHYVMEERPERVLRALDDLLARSPAN